MTFLEYLNKRSTELNATATELDGMFARLPVMTTQQRLALHRILVELTTIEKSPAAAGGPNLDVYFSQRATERRRKATVITTNAVTLPPFTREHELVLADMIRLLQRKDVPFSVYLNP